MRVELLNDLRAVVEEVCRHIVHNLPDSPAEGIGEGCAGARSVNAHETIASIPREAGGATRGGDRRHVAVRVERDLLVAEHALAVGSVIGGACDRVGEQGPCEAAANLGASPRSIVLVREIPKDPVRIAIDEAREP